MIPFVTFDITPVFFYLYDYINNIGDPDLKNRKSSLNN